MTCNGLNKIHAKNLITKKNSCNSLIPLPLPHNFSNCPSLIKDRFEQVEHELPLLTFRLDQQDFLSYRKFHIGTTRKLVAIYISARISGIC